ncbi:MAG: cyclic nucleotide-binding domain-containing protein [candidate division Zixibacteria bacterium]|nr:cyclic nucleotide-binding domain-containing protein [candidate division Zixibacteria bacterium]
MLTIIEKVIFLQNIDLFSEVPTEQLASMATIAEEVSFLKGDIVYKENDHSDSLYIIMRGKIRMKRENQEIALAENGEAFGTWALFDNEPRVVTAVVDEDCDLLRIAQDDFVDLLSDHIQVTQGVLKSIVKRLRTLVAKVS